MSKETSNKKIVPTLDRTRVSASETKQQLSVPMKFIKKSKFDVVICHECGGKCHFKSECPTALRTEKENQKTLNTTWSDSDGSETSEEGEDLDFGCTTNVVAFNTVKITSTPGSPKTKHSHSDIGTNSESKEKDEGCELLDVEEVLENYKIIYEKYILLEKRKKKLTMKLKDVRENLHTEISSLERKLVDKEKVINELHKKIVELEKLHAEDVLKLEDVELTFKKFKVEKAKLDDALISRKAYGDKFGLG